MQGVGPILGKITAEHSETPLLIAHQELGACSWMRIC